MGVIGMPVVVDRLLGLQRRVLVGVGMDMIVNMGMFVRMNVLMWMRVHEVAVPVLMAMGVGVRMLVPVLMRMGMGRFVGMTMLAHRRLQSRDWT